MITTQIKKGLVGEFRSINEETITVINGYFPQEENKNHPNNYKNKKSPLSEQKMPI